MECSPQGIYRPRDAQATALYHLVEDNFDELERVWDDRYEKQHGFWRPVIRHVVEQYLDCGDLRCGFERLRCASCRKDLLLPFSCKRRYFCSSCHQKRALLFAEHVDRDVMGDLPVRQYVVTIPKMLRLCFKYDRKLLGVLRQCFYASVKELFQDAAAECGEWLPGMIGSLHYHGDNPTRFHPHIPNAGQQLVRYCGAFSNVRRAGADLSGSAPGKELDAPEAQAQHPGCADDFARQMRRSWARLIKKVYEADPLICPRCGGPLKIISLIDSAPVIERILRHLKLWNRPERPPPPAPERYYTMTLR